MTTVCIMNERVMKHENYINKKTETVNYDSTNKWDGNAILLSPQAQENFLVLLKRWGEREREKKLIECMQKW